MREKICRVTLLLGVVAFGLVWYFEPTYAQDEALQALFEGMVFRLLGSVVFLSLCLYFRYRLFHLPPRSSWKVWLPCVAVVVNNLPILALARGEARLERWDLLPLFVADVLLIGIFEEIAFRGTLFLAILEKRRDSRKRIFLTTVVSSAVFGLLHLANLLDGAGVGTTLMQVGYSFLIGGMCSIVLLKTGNLLIPILLHSVFDFCGKLVPTLGSGRIWNLPTIVITAVLAVVVAAWEILVLLHVKPEETEKFYPTPSTDSEEGE